MSRLLRFIACGLLAVAVLATAFITHHQARMYGGGPYMLCFSFAPVVLLVGALVLARSKAAGISTVVLLALATAWDLLVAHGVFRATARGELVDLIGFTVHTMGQGLLSLVAFAVALADWLVHRFK